MSSSHQHQQGASLIEVLIALMLVAFTMLWSVRTATDGLGVITDAIYYQRATRFAADIDELFTMLPAEYRNNPPDTRTTACNFTTPCTPNDWLDWNITVIDKEIRTSLPAGRLDFSTTDAGLQPLARLSWSARDGETRDLTWQPGT